ncbi:MAG: DNRLRE domain-containing protein [bacterium]|nr:DNRLRE domain-containing protein [bacterium]
MKKLTKLTLAVGLLAILAVGCSDNPTLTGPEGVELNYESLAAAVQLPAGATITSATLNLYCAQATDQSINVHRVTSAWDEMTVTWDNFGGAYDPTVVGTFAADVVGWRSVDITTLVQAWSDGTQEDLGVLIDQVDKATPRTWYNSRNNSANHPYLEICYTVAGAQVCETADCVADAYMWELARYDNFGASTMLYTGWETDTDFEKQSLLRFDLESEPPSDEGCTYTIGKWKNWTGLGNGNQADIVTPLLPIWLGTADGDKSLYVEDAATAVAVLRMKTYGRNSNGITKLYAQLLGTKLNLANGATGAVVAGAIAEADAFLADHDWKDWRSLGDDQETVLGWKDTLDDYNNGIIGPGHCDDGDGDGEKKKKRHRNHHRWHKGKGCKK